MNKACRNKNCEDFGIMKDAEENFHKNSQILDGYHPYCKKCRNKDHSKYETTKNKKRNKAGTELLAMLKESKGK